MTGFPDFRTPLPARRLTGWTKMSAVILLCCLPLFPVLGQGAGLPDDPAATVWHLSAGTVTYDRQADLYIAEDGVVITGGRTRLEADYVEFSNVTRDVSATGRVRLISGGDVITCNAMQINLVTETGQIDKGTLFIQETHLYIHGEQIRKTGKFSYSAEKGSITACGGDTPDWKITGRDVRVTIEGYGFAKNTTFWAGNVPALYSPFLAFPVKTTRQTGLLMPEISSSDRLGYVYDQPFFWAISPSRDATFHAGYLSDRGVRVGGEYRYVSDDASFGIWQLDYLSDDKIDDGTDATRNYRFNSTPVRTETDRYWLRAKSDQALPHGFSARLDLDVVSDADYLLEFRDGMAGYDRTSGTFASRFGRDLDEYDDDIRKNSLVLDRIWSQHLLNVSALWYDNVTARQTGADDTTLQTLPGIEFYSVRQPLGSGGVFYTMDSHLTSFFRQDTVDTIGTERESAKVNGRRLDLYNRLFYPLRPAKGVALEPFIGVRGTTYHTDSFTDVHGDDDPFRFRGIYELGGDLSTRLNRVFTAPTGFSDKIRHQVTPGLGYRFLPRVDQEDLPYFDGLDDIEETNRFTWSVTNLFTARKTAAGEDETAVNQYRELGWVRFFQDYDITREQAGRDAKARPWSDLAMDAEIFPFSFLTLRSDLAWSPYTGHFTALNLDTTLTSPRGDSVTTAYRYTLDTAESWYTRFNLRITRGLSAFYAFEKDLDTRETIETRTGILLEKPCWTLGLDFRESDLDRRIALMIGLKGIGEFSTQ